MADAPLLSPSPSTATAPAVAAAAPPVSAPAPVVPLKRALADDDHAPSVPSPLNPEARARSTAPTAATPPPSQQQQQQSQQPKQGLVREQRERKDSAKKRESNAAAAAAAAGAAEPVLEKNGKKSKMTTTSQATPLALPSPTRYNHPLPREAFHYGNKDPLWASHEPEPFITSNGIELKRPLDSVENKKMYRYTHCVADPNFQHSRYYRASDEKPYGPRMSFVDSDKWFNFDAATGTICTNEKGWRMGRANICAREGSFYYEVKILRGGVAASDAVDGANPGDNNGATLPPPNPHVRMGWARREAPLDAPVGFDGYSYGLTDIRMEPMHRSRASKFLDTGIDIPSKKSAKSAKQRAEAAKNAQFAANDNLHEGDVVGLEITLPSLSLHRKVVDGVYNPLIDTGAGIDDASVGDVGGAPNIVRDRFPVPYKGAMHFESMELRPSKGMEAYGDRGPFARETPDPNHADPTLRTLPGSSVRMYKNGRLIGTAFRNLMAFLPPASQPHMEKGVRTGLDDGMVGYYPAVSVFSGGIAHVNFGPDFWCAPAGLDGRSTGDEALNGRGSQGDQDTVMTGTADSAAADVDKTAAAEASETSASAAAASATTTAVATATAAEQQLRRRGTRGAHVRYVEQVAEDVVWDLVDEADFHVQDGGGSHGNGINGNGGSSGSTGEVAAPGVADA